MELIGLEHSAEDIVGRFFSARDSGCVRCSISRRIDVPGTSMHGMGEISPPSGADKVGPAAVIPQRWVLRRVLRGGFDLDYAEYAGSPKDTVDYSELNNGNTIEAVRRRMFGRGFGAIRCGDGCPVDPDENYLRATGSI